MGRRNRMRAPDGAWWPLRVVRYEAQPDVVEEMREYDTDSAELLPALLSPGVNEYRWSDAAGTRVYVLRGKPAVAELEELARRLGELKVIP